MATEAPWVYRYSAEEWQDSDGTWHLRKAGFEIVAAKGDAK